MKQLTGAIFLFNLIIFLGCYSNLCGQSIPHLQKKGSTQELIVDGKPFLILGGEFGNSTASSLEYLRPAWSKFKDMNLNTILVPVYWELTEPEEGKFNFTLVDSVLKISNDNNLKVILLWFGSWKNSMSCYAPAWIKTNQSRFPRAQDQTGKGLEILSSLAAIISMLI